MSITDQKKITGNSMLESDLGITGDDGIDLLKSIEEAFDVVFSDSENGYRTIFNLKKNEYLFHAEGLDLFGLVEFMFRKSRKGVKSISVSDLHQVIVKLQLEKFTE